jgi:hypothetical protein
MACTDCDNSNISLTGSWFPGNPCENNDCGGASTNASCVIYNGPTLSCSGIETLDNVEAALQKIDEQICAISGDYSTYNMNCLPTWWEAAITNQATFVDAITKFACEIRDNLATFIGVVYVCNQEILDDRLKALEVPGITCSFASVVSTDTLQQVLGKYCTKFGDIEASLNLSSVTWNNCLTISGNPITVASGFQLISDQICSLYALIAGGGILPTFNNTLSCIGGGSSDSLLTTITLIKNRLCLSPTLNMDNIVWGCFTEEATFEDVIIKMVSTLGTLSANFVQFNAGDFILTPLDATNPCGGNMVSLAASLNADRFVAVNALDTSPGTLNTKLSGSSSILLTTVSNSFINITVADTNYGDIIVTGTGASWAINPNVVSFAKIQDVSSGSILGRSSIGTGDIEQLSLGSNMSLSAGILNTVGRTLIGITKFTASGTWFKPTGCNAIVVEIVGAGGGGGGANTVANLQSGAGGGGASGSYLKLFITSGLGATETVGVGIGGGSVSTGTASSGTSSSFGSHGTADGGLGGDSMIGGTSSSVTAGGQSNAYSVASPGTMLIGSRGSHGHHGIRLSGTVAYSGVGGSSVVGGSSGGGFLGPGAGGIGTFLLGTGSTTAVTGWAGSNGIVIVYEYS